VPRAESSSSEKEKKGTEKATLGCKQKLYPHFLLESTPKKKQEKRAKT